MLNFFGLSSEWRMLAGYDLKAPTWRSGEDVPPSHVLMKFFLDDFLYRATQHIMRVINRFAQSADL